jgi:hypothetical protein
MEVRVNLAQEDFQAFMRHLSSSRSKGDKHPQQAKSDVSKRVTWLAYIVVIGGGLIVSLGQGGPRVHFNNPRVCAALVFFGLVGLAFFWAWLSRRNSPRRAFEEARNKGLVNGILISITPEQFSYCTQVSTTTHQWSALDRVEHTDEHIFIMTAQWSGYIIPRRAFATEPDFLNFYETARRYQQGSHDKPASGHLPLPRGSERFPPPAESQRPGAIRHPPVD